MITHTLSSWSKNSVGFVVIGPKQVVVISTDVSTDDCDCVFVWPDDDLPPDETEMPPPKLAKPPEVLTNNVQQLKYRTTNYYSAANFWRSKLRMTLSDCVEINDFSTCFSLKMFSFVTVLPTHVKCYLYSHSVKGETIILVSIYSNNNITTTIRNNNIW